MKRLAKRAFILLFILVVGACIGFVILLRQSSPSDSLTITELEQYPELLESFANNPSIQHFPAQLPPHASESYLYYSPRMFQGGTIFQLRLKMPLDEILAEKDRYRPQAISIFESTPIPIAGLGAGYEERIPFPETFELIWLGAEPAGEENNKWNHGSTYGIAIDEINSEIVYWFEWW